MPCIYEQLVQMHLRDLINRGESSASRKSSHETYPDAQNSEKGDKKVKIMRPSM